MTEDVRMPIFAEKSAGEVPRRILRYLIALTAVIAAAFLLSRVETLAIGDKPDAGTVFSGSSFWSEDSGWEHCQEALQTSPLPTLRYSTGTSRLGRVQVPQRNLNSLYWRRDAVALSGPIWRRQTAFAPVVCLVRIFLHPSTPVRAGPLFS